MRRTQATILGLTWAALSLAGVAAPEAVAAQSELDAAEAQAFIGDWLVRIPTEQGEMLVELGIEDEDGKVAGSVTMIGLGTQPVSDITREGEMLQFVLEADAQGQIIPILVQLTPNGEELAVHLELNDGELTVDGVGTRMAN